MAQLQSLNDIKKLGVIMSVWAHPDDESYLAAGIMAAAVNNGQKVICVTATKGEAGSQDLSNWPPETLGEVRAQELRRALDEIGVLYHHWLGYSDGLCDRVKEKEAVNQLIKLINMYNPQSILTFGPDGITGHTDHKTVSRWVDKATKNLRDIKVYHAVVTFRQYNDYLKRIDQELNIFFNVKDPVLVEDKDCAIKFDLPPSICEKKCNAVAAMPSQTEIFFRLFGREYIKNAYAGEYFVSKNMK